MPESRKLSEADWQRAAQHKKDLKPAGNNVASKKPTQQVVPETRSAQQIAIESSKTGSKVVRLLTLGLLGRGKSPSESTLNNPKLKPIPGLSKLAKGLWPKLDFLQQSHAWIMHNEGKSSDEIGAYITGLFEQ